MTFPKILSKSRYTKALQCEKLLWWSVNEPDAPELIVDGATQARFDAGHKVGALARTYVPGGILIERPDDDFEAPIKATAAALKAGARTLYEATFVEDEIYCAVDILERAKGGWGLIEVKSSTKVKPEHLPDAAVQVYVARKAGLDVKRVEIMVLNRQCRFPDLKNLFTRHDVTKDVLALVKTVEKNAKKFLSTLNLPAAPAARIGAHCHSPRPCPFKSRCHAEVPPHHVSTLYFTNFAAAEKWAAAGFHKVTDLDEHGELTAIQRRQILAVKTNTTVVEKGLASRLARLNGPLAFLDFETVAPAVPAWEGCRSYDGVPAQFSCHVEDGQGGHIHHEWIATKPGDPRPELARALVEACKGSATILAYNAGFEKGKIRDLALHLPEFESALLEIADRIDDLLPILREHVYHPAFEGSFSIKSVLPALCPELSYDTLTVRDGSTASWVLETIMTDAGRYSAEEMARHVDALKAYCKLDTWAMVALLGKLRELAGS